MSPGQATASAGLPRWLRAWLFNRRWLAWALVLSLMTHIGIGLLFRVRSMTGQSEYLSGVPVRFVPDLAFGGMAGEQGLPVEGWSDDPTLFALPHEDGFSRTWFSDRPILVVPPQEQISVIPKPQLAARSVGPVPMPPVAGWRPTASDSDVGSSTLPPVAEWSPGARRIRMTSGADWEETMPVPSGLESLLAQAPTSGRTVYRVAASPSGTPTMILVERSCGIMGLDEWGRALLRGLVPDIPAPEQGVTAPVPTDPAADLVWRTVTIDWPFAPRVQS